MTDTAAAAAHGPSFGGLRAAAAAGRPAGCPVSYSAV